MLSRETQLELEFCEQLKSRYTTSLRSTGLLKKVTEFTFHGLFEDLSDLLEWLWFFYNNKYFNEPLLLLNSASSSEAVQEEFVTKDFLACKCSEKSISSIDISNVSPLHSGRWNSIRSCIMPLLIEHGIIQYTGTTTSLNNLLSYRYEFDFNQFTINLDLKTLDLKIKHGGKSLPDAEYQHLANEILLSKIVLYERKDGLVYHGEPEFYRYYIHHSPYIHSVDLKDIEAAEKKMGVNFPNQLRKIYKEYGYGSLRYGLHTMNPNDINRILEPMEAADMYLKRIQENGNTNSVVFFEGQKGEYYSIDNTGNIINYENKKTRVPLFDSLSAICAGRAYERFDWHDTEQTN